MEKELTMQELVIATKNPDKKKELITLLRNTKIKVISLDRFPSCPDVQEGHKSFRQNAIRKAMMVSRWTKKPTLADDSGLETDALGGRPGVCSARFAGKNVSYQQNNQKLLRLLKDKPLRQRGAQFRCVVAVCDYPRLLGVIEAKVRGRIALVPQGRYGFGYDPIFILPKYNKTFAQLGSCIKNKISHRAKALKKAKRLILGYFQLKS